MKVVYYKTLPIPDKDSKLLQYGFEAIVDGMMVYMVLVVKSLDGVNRYYINWYVYHKLSLLRIKDHIKHACRYLSNEYTMVDIEDIKTFFKRKGMSIDNESFFETFTLDKKE